MENSENKKILRAAGSIAAATLCSRVLGFIRDMIVARFFGASASADAFYVAYRIPNLFRELLAEGTMSAAFVPVFTEYLSTREREEARELASSVFTALLIFATLVVGVGLLAAPYLVRAIAPGFTTDPDKFAATVFMTRLMFPYLLFISLAALTMGMLNSLRIFFAPALTPVILNIFIISIVVLLTPVVEPPVAAAAYGVLAGGFFQFLFLLPFLRKEKMSLGLRPFFSHPGVKRIFKLMGPVVAGLSVTQVNLFINTILASFLAVGSVSYLYYGMRLIHFPLGILGIAISTAILPSFSTLAAQKDLRAHGETLAFGLRFVLFITLPAMVGLMALRVPLVNLLLQHGEFDFSATVGTAGAIFYYSLGLWSFASVRVVTQAFYSLQDTKTPMKAAAFSVAAGIAISVGLLPVMKHQGLALATSLASILNLSILLHRYGRRDGLKFREIGSSLLRSLVAVIPIIGCGFYVSSHYSWDESGDILSKCLILAPTVLGAMVSYFFIHYLLKTPELNFLIEQMKKRKSASTQGSGIRSQDSE